MSRQSLRKRVLAFDPQIVVREGLANLLKQSPFQLVGVENNLDLFLDRLQDETIDALIMEPLSQGKRDWPAIDRIFDRKRDARVLIYSSAETPPTIAVAYKIGVLGVVTKQSDRDTLLNALLTVCDGKKYFMDEIKDQLLDLMTSQPYQVDARRVLGARDLAIFTMLSEGHKPSAVAKATGLKDHYIRNRSDTIAKLLGIQRGDFTKVARAHALIPEAL